MKILKKILLVCEENNKDEICSLIKHIIASPEIQTVSRHDKTINEIIQNGYDLVIFDFNKRGPILELINLSYVSGKKLLIIVNNQRNVGQIERYLEQSIKDLQNVKYIPRPICFNNLKKRINQLSNGKGKSTCDIFEELQANISKEKSKKTFFQKMFSLIH